MTPFDDQYRTGNRSRNHGHTDPTIRNSSSPRAFEASPSITHYQHTHSFIFRASRKSSRTQHSLINLSTYRRSPRSLYCLFVLVYILCSANHLPQVGCLMYELLEVFSDLVMTIFCTYRLALVS
ncbi:hypothetical protein F5Y18DRAFT_123637 [Xylariaceae sp. FL1019]|nr:hypothetical protein F5Y18DRAFT_123637 [Xylariaceae sp. FL1019]